jgi:F-type H+-transporting ATPase subunit delta
MKIKRQIKRAAKRLFRDCLVDGLLDEGRARTVVQGVAGARRRSSPALLAHFRRLVQLDVARRTATVESAAPLSPELRDGLQASLARRYGPGVTTAFRDRPSLIGGMRVQVGSDVYDGSVEARLAALKARFLK